MMKTNTNKLIISIVVFCVAAGSAFGYALYGAGKKSAEMQAQGDQTNSQNSGNAAAVENTQADTKDTNGAADTSASGVSTAPADTQKKTVYKNGTYTAVGSYRSPAGAEQISVTVTLRNDIIISTSAKAMANDQTSDRYQGKFIGGYSAQIVGKNIDTVELDQVSGSSLTSAGFNEALAKIKVSAKA